MLCKKICTFADQNHICGMCAKIEYCRLFFIVICSSFLGSCVTNRQVNYMQKPVGNIPSYADTVMFTDYTVQKGDRLYIRVYSTNEETNTYFNSGMDATTLVRMMNTTNTTTTSMELYTYLVNDNGEITYPMIGNVYVRGMGSREIKEVLEEKLAGVVSDISVEVKIINRTFSVIGAKYTGKYVIPKEKLTIFEALAMAGDISTYGDRSKVRIIRETDSGTTVKMFDVRSEDIINSEFYYIEPNDVIYIQAMDRQIFGATSLASVISITASTVSFGLFLYAFIDDYIVQPVKERQ